MSYLTQVDARVWRGSRPEPSDFPLIRGKFGTVISLEGAEEDRKEMAELAPVRVISQTISFPEIYFSGIPLLRLSAITSLPLLEGVKKPVLIHCQHGEDRTGLIVAAYRVQSNGLTLDEAWEEALQFGYRDWLNFGLNRTWGEFKRDWTNKQS